MTSCDPKGQGYQDIFG